MVSHALGLKHGLAAQEMKNLTASTVMTIILCIYTELHVKASLTMVLAEQFLLYGWGEKSTQ